MVDDQRIHKNWGGGGRISQANKTKAALKRECMSIYDMITFSYTFKLCMNKYFSY